jgi:hypothetical protein
MTITTDNELMRNEVFDAINSVVEVKDLGVIESFLGMQFKYNKQLRYLLAHLPRHLHQGPVRHDGPAPGICKSCLHAGDQAGDPAGAVCLPVS